MKKNGLFGLLMVPCAFAMAFGVMTFSTDASAGADNVLGCWKTIDDKTKTPKSIVKIWKSNGKVFGKILKLFRKPPQELDPKCDKCKGKRKGQRVIGMTMIWNLKQNGYWWKGGNILDPANGKVYRAELWTANKGASKSILKVRGFVAFFYRTQTWHRVAKCPKMAAKKAAKKPAKR